MTSSSDSLPPPPSVFPRFRRVFLPLLAGILLFAVVFALFAPAIRYGFVDVDDPTYVTGNRLVLSGLSAASVAEAFRSFDYASMYMPLLWLSYMLDVSLFGASPDNPVPFHATNVVLHAANAVLFFFLLRLLGRIFFPSIATRRPAFVTLLPPFLLSLLWAVHPLRVESVAWVTERKDVLSTFFALLSVFFYLEAFLPGERMRPPRDGDVGPEPPFPARRSRNGFLCLALGAFVAALLVKPALVPFPLLLLLLDTLLLRRPLSVRLFLEKLPWMFFAAAAVASTLLGHRGAAIPLPLSTRIAHVPQTLAYYLRVVFLPMHLTLLEPDPVFALLPTLLAAAVLAAFLFFACRLWRAVPAATLGILWFFLFLLPFSGLVPIPNATVVDRFTYVPALGLSVALLPLGNPVALPVRFRRVAVLLALALLAALAVLTARLLPFWRSSDALFDRIRRFSPAHRFLAVHDIRHAITLSGDFPAVRRIAGDALALNPADPLLSMQLATGIANTDGPAPAFDFLSRNRPDRSEFLGKWAWGMAHLSLRLGRRDDALAYADLAAAATPPPDILQSNIQRLRVAAAAPDSADALPHYISQWMTYERADALDFFRRFTAANPGRPDILANIAWILATANWSPAPPSEALDYASRAIALAPDPPPPELLDTYAAALANAADFSAAANAQERAIALLPPSSPSLPDYQARLALYRQSLPYRRDIGIDR